MFNYANIWCPGAVDVDDGIGLVRHGMIRNIIPSTGLIIDFGYPDHHADLIPFSQCTTKPRRAKVTEPNCKIETLFQRSSDQPWCWYPSKLLAGSLDTYAFVEIDFDGETLRDVISLERVRPMRKDSRFRQHEVELPETEEELMAVTKEKWFLSVWSSKTQTVGVKVDGARLTYISQQPSPMTGDMIKQHLRSIVEDFSCHKRSRELRRKLMNISRRLRIQQTSRGKKRTADGDLITSKTAATPRTLTTIKRPSCNISRMPVDILLNLFSFLNVDDQVNSRAVCATWSDVLTSVPASFRIQIDLTECDNEALASALHKMVTKSTKILVLTGNHNETMLTHNPFRIVCDLLKAKGMKVGTIVIARRCMWADDVLDYSDEQAKIRPTWSEACDQLVLEEVEVCAVLGCQSASSSEVLRRLRESGFRRYREMKPEDLVLPVTGRVAVGKQEGLMETLDLFEAACPIMNLQKRTYLQLQWPQFAENNEFALQIRQRLLKVIHYWEPRDPQPYADAEWSMKQLNSLRELTTHAVLFQCEHDMRIRDLDLRRRAMQGMQ